MLLMRPPVGRTHPLMCNPACIDFGVRVVTADDVGGKQVIEVGSMNVNGSLRETIEAHGPATYIGVDLGEGPGVDEVCPAEALIARFGEESFDLVVCTEMLEHAREWRVVVTNLKHLVAPGGVLLVTTRSKGFPYHEYPFDYWRFEPDDMRAIFADFSIEVLERDTYMPGVFMKARRTNTAKSEPDLGNYKLYSIVAARRCKHIAPLDHALFRVRYPIERFLKTLIPKSFRDAVRTRVGSGPQG
jgi:SAM-dependent methyltransferase